MDKTENELIAEFMDQDYLKRRLKSHLYDGYTKDQFYESLPFHESWDWLMPVVEKIETGLDWKYEVLIEHDLFAETNLYSVTIYDVGKATCIQIDSIKSKIKAVYKAVVEFIKWHNSQKL